MPLKSTRSSVHNFLIRVIASFSLSNLSRLEGQLFQEGTSFTAPPVPTFKNTLSGNMYPSIANTWATIAGRYLNMVFRLQNLMTWCFYSSSIIYRFYLISNGIIQAQAPKCQNHLPEEKGDIRTAITENIKQQILSCSELPTHFILVA